jgi:hypothetical protein
MKINSEQKTVQAVENAYHMGRETVIENRADLFLYDRSPGIREVWNAPLNSKQSARRKNIRKN